MTSDALLQAHMAVLTDCCSAAAMMKMQKRTAATQLLKLKKKKGQHLHTHLDTIMNRVGKTTRHVQTTFTQFSNNKLARSSIIITLHVLPTGLKHIH